MTLDTLLFDAGFLFFAAFIAVIAGVSLTAFGQDLLSSNTRVDQPTADSADSVRPTRSIR